MSKMTAAAVCLIPALAGGLLIYVCTLGGPLLGYADSSGGFKMLGGMGALLGVFLAASPILAFVVTPSPEGTRPAKKKEEEVEPVAESAAESAAEAEAFEDAAEAEAEEGEESAVAEASGTDDDLVVTDASMDEFSASEESSINASDFEASEDFDDLAESPETMATEDEDEDQPRKRKK